MQVEVRKDPVILLRVGVAKAYVLKVDGALAHDQRLSSLVIRHERGLVEHARHLGRISQGMVDARHHGVKVVEVHREVIGVREHHDERTRTDAEPGIAARDEDRDDEHDDCDEEGGGEPPPHGGAHVAVLRRHGIAIRPREGLALEVLATVGLHGEDVRDGIGEHTRKLVLGVGGVGGEHEDPLVHAVGQNHIEHEHGA